MIELTVHQIILPNQILYIRTENGARVRYILKCTSFINDILECIKLFIDVQIRYHQRQDLLIQQLMQMSHVSNLPTRSRYK